jgi:hypothetical protein
VGVLSAVVFILIAAFCFFFGARFKELMMSRVGAN